METQSRRSSQIPFRPPSYSSSTSTRSILDLHTQIRANASILDPKNNDARSSDDHLEVITAEAPASSSPLAQSPPQAAGSNKNRLSMSSFTVGSAKSPNPAGAGSSTGVMNARNEGGGGHYAVLVKRTNSRKSIKIILKSQTRATVEDALEDLLRLTELELHLRLELYGRQMKDDECCVM